MDWGEFYPPAAGIRVNVTRNSSIQSADPKNATLQATTKYEVYWISGSPVAEICKYIIPALPTDLIADQFAYRPTGSTTSALISLIHSVTQKLES